MSSFREAIFIDADALFFDNPAVLFDDIQYQDTGALFFKDRSILPEDKKKWLREILPGPISRQVKQSRLWTGESGHMQESGVVVIDKWRHFVPLLLATRLNGPERDGDATAGKQGVYEMVHGECPEPSMRDAVTDRLQVIKRPSGSAGSSLETLTTHSTTAALLRWAPSRKCQTAPRANRLS